MEHSFLIAISGPPTGAETHPLIGMMPIVLIFLVFYFILILPARNKQKKLDALVAALKPGDRIIVTPGILGTVVAVEGQTVQVRVDEKTKIRVLRSAVAELQDGSPETEKK